MLVADEERLIYQLIPMQLGRCSCLYVSVGGQLTDLSLNQVFICIPITDWFLIDKLSIEFVEILTTNNETKATKPTGKHGRWTSITTIKNFIYLQFKRCSTISKTMKWYATIFISLCHVRPRSVMHLMGNNSKMVSLKWNSSIVIFCSAQLFLNTFFSLYSILFFVNPSTCSYAGFSMHSHPIARKQQRSGEKRLT